MESVEHKDLWVDAGYSALALSALSASLCLSGWPWCRVLQVTTTKAQTKGVTVMRFLASSQRPVPADA